MQRRDSLKALVALSTWGLWGAPLIASASPSSALSFAGLFEQRDGQRGVAVLHGDQLWHHYPLPFRGHGLAHHAAQADWLWIIGRRPSQQLARLHLPSGELQLVVTPDDRVLGGHALYSADGRYLLTSESEIEHGAGYIGVYDAQGGQRLQEWPTHGVGPHELLLHGQTLWVANGGIHTDAERNPLQLAQMQSSLVALDVSSGELQQRYCIDEQYASLRHLAMTEQGQLLIAAQFQRSVAEHQRPVALLWSLSAGEQQLRPFHAPAWERYHDYLGSVSVSANRVLVSAPQSDCVVLFDGTQQTWLAEYHGREACGVVALADQLLYSDALGSIQRISSAQSELFTQQPEWLWDNHLLALSA